MEISTLLEELREKDFFKEFSNQFESYFAAAFIVLDDAGSDKYQLDFFIPKEKKIASVEYPFKAVKIHEDFIEGAARLKVASIDICELRGRVEDVKKKTISD